MAVRISESMVLGRVGISQWMFSIIFMGGVYEEKTVVDGHGYSACVVNCKCAIWTKSKSDLFTDISSRSVTPPVMPFFFSDDRLNRICMIE